MKAADASAALDAAVKSKTFNSSDGRGVEERGRQALAALPKGVDAPLVQRAYRRYLDESPYSVWRVAGKLRPEHAVGFRAELARAEQSIQTRFLVTAAGKLEDYGGRLKRAGEALAQIHKFSHAAKDRAAAEKVRFIADDAPILAAVQAAFAATAKPDLTELLDWLWFISVLALDGSAASVKALKPAVARAIAGQGRDDSHFGGLSRLLRMFDDRPAIKRLADEMDKAKKG